jgi:acyl carrier protein
LQDILAKKGDLAPIASDSALFTSGRLQSIDGVQVAVFLEERFGVDFATLGFDQEKIDTVDSICALVEESRPKEQAHP